MLLPKAATIILPAAILVLLGARDGAAGNPEVIIADDAVAVIPGDSEAAGAVDGQIVLTVDSRADRVISVAHHVPVGQHILRAFDQCQDQLVRLFFIDGGTFRARDDNAVQNQPHLVVFGDLHQDLALQRTGQKIVPLFPDLHRAFFGIQVNHLNGGGIERAVRVLLLLDSSFFESLI